MERKLTNFTSPHSSEKGGKYHIDFAYYEDGQWTGIHEGAELTEDELYLILKPVLQLEYTNRKGG